MPITRGEISGRILRLVNKTASFPGFYTKDKISDAIEEGLDFLAVKMFLAGEGWQDKLKYFTTQPQTVSIPLTSDISMIKEVRFLFGGVYTPMVYDDANRKEQVDGSSGAFSGYTGTYRVIDNCLYFNPPLSEGGTNYIQLEYTGFPKRLSGDHDAIEGHFFKPFVHWLVYWACSRLVSGVGKPDPDWGRQEQIWFNSVEQVITRRNMQTTTIREFEG